MFHKVYQPTEYEELLIAAKIIDLGSIDPDYLEYKRAQLYPLGYDHWQGLRALWNDLDKDYETEFGQSAQQPAWHERERLERQRSLLDQMSQLEVELGY